MEFKCSLCSAAFFYKRYLTDHNTRVHGQKIRNQLFRCTYCVEDFPSKTALRKHISTCHKEKEHIGYVQCQEENCLEKFRTVYDFRKHLMATHQIKEIGNYQELNFENYSGTYVKLLVLFIGLFYKSYANVYKSYALCKLLICLMLNIYSVV